MSLQQPHYHLASPGPFTTSYNYQPRGVSNVNDASAFRHFYATQLATLTFNSRPIIQNLSILAMNNNHRSAIIVECVAAHIRKSTPIEKLPGFYLLDSIAKNAFMPYANQFAAIVVSLFLDCHRVVDSITRSKMESMLVTWRTGAPNGRELFGANVQLDIERSIWGSGLASHSVPSLGSSPPHPNKMQVLAELEVVLGQKERNVRLNPFDTTSTAQVEALKQLRTFVQASSLAPEELSNILTQLLSLVASERSVMVQPSANVTSSASPPGNVHSSKNPHLPPIALQSTASSVPLAPVVSTVMPSVTDLYNSLLKAGLVSAPTDIAAANDVKGQTKIVDPKAEALKEYERNIMQMKVTFTGAGLSKSHPQVVPFLYDRQPLQCKQCAARFPEDVDGSKQMEAHLDMHFRQNSKANQSLGRGHTRSWFVGSDNWKQDVSRVCFSNGKDGQVVPLNGKAKVATADRDTELRNLFVVVPAGDEAKQIICPICKELFKSEFKEDDEDWVWNNAVSIQGKIYHATCHAELSTSRAMAGRLRSNVPGRDRSSTPEKTLSKESIPSSSRLAIGNVAGTKRKFEDISTNSNSDRTSEPPADEQPPLKKMALAV